MLALNIDAGPFRIQVNTEWTARRFQSEHSCEFCGPCPKEFSEYPRHPDIVEPILDGQQPKGLR